MGANAAEALEFAGVGHEAHDLEPPVMEPEEDAETDIIDACVEGAVHTGQPPAIIAFDGIGRMHVGIRLVMIGFLENLEGADAGFLNDFEIIDGHRGRVDVNATDIARAVACFDADGVDGVETLGDEVGPGFRMFAVDGHDSLVSIASRHGFGLGLDLVKGEAAALLQIVVTTESAVATAVDAVAGDIHRREGDDAVIVHKVLDLECGLLHLLAKLGIRNVQEEGRFGGIERLDGEGFREDFADANGVGVSARFELTLDQGIVDEVVAMGVVARDLVALDDGLRSEFSVHNFYPWVQSNSLPQKEVLSVPKIRREVKGWNKFVVGV